MHLHRLLHSLNISTEHSACPMIYVGYTIHKKVPEIFFLSPSRSLREMEIFQLKGLVYQNLDLKSDPGTTR